MKIYHRRQWLLFNLVCLLSALPPAGGHAQVEFRKPTWQDVNPFANPDSRVPDSQVPDFGAREETAPDPRGQGGRFQFSAARKSSRPEPIVTRQNAFGVPFSVNPDVGPIREVQLHISSNRGETWSMYSRQLPTAGEFPFRAVADGEYWFAVKTVGSTIPDQKLEPELVIVIDSQKPNFNVALKTDALGRLVVSWRATDENLDPSSIQIAYQSVATWGQRPTNWQTVQLPEPNPAVDQVYEDEIAFYADTSNVSLDLRISIADKAGNVAVITRRFNLPRTASRAAPATQPLNIASRIDRPTGSVPPAAPGDRPPSTDPYSGFTQQDKDDAAERVGMNASFDPQSSQSPDRSGGGLASSGNRYQGWHFQGASGIQQDFPGNRPPTVDPAPTRDNDPRPSSVSDPGFQSPHRLASSGRSSAETEEAFQRGSNRNRIPSGQYAKLSSSQKFELDYLVEHIQPDDISKLEIWVTEDAGDSWKLLTTDPDRQSPVTIEVTADGIYGYRIRIQTVDGLESTQPTRGDSADVWVEVDTTPPAVRLKSIPYGRRTDAGKLIVNWEATDRRLAVKPITLFYSVNLDGPWQIIVEKLENTGQFKWPVTDRIPRQVYLRIEAIDAAGNKNYHQTEQTIDLSGLNPRGMIRSVRPIK